MPNRPITVGFPGAIPLTVSLLLLVFFLGGEMGPLGPLIIIFLAVAWLLAGCRWLVRKYGRRGIAVIVVSGGLLFASIVIGYFVDRPDRQLVSQIEQLPGCSPFTNGKILTGKVDSVYIGSKASDKEVWQFTQLQGLDPMWKLFIDGVRIRDETAKELSRFKGLRYLTLRQTGVTLEVVNDLRRKLPKCRIHVD